MKKITALPIFLALFISCQEATDQYTQELLFDDFSTISRGPYSVDVGAHTEYHYIHEAAPRSQWAVSSFTSEVPFQRAWHVRQEGDDRQMVQVFRNDRRNHTHPMVVAGEHDWEDYVAEVQFTPAAKDLQSGLVFRYRNDRNYYFAGVKGDSLILKMVKDATGFRQPYEKILGKAYLAWEAGEKLTLEVKAIDNELSCVIREANLQATDDTYPDGNIGLMADAPTKYHQVDIKTTTEELKRMEDSRAAYAKELAALQSTIPKMKVWKKMNTTGFGVGRNLRFGDLNNDGELDILIGQVVNHGPKDRNTELSCLTAMTTDGELLWQTGEPDPWKVHQTSDVAFQIYDLDHDGQSEVIYTMNLEIVVADGATGRVKYKKSTPLVTDHEEGDPHNKFGKILGDAIYFCDLAGNGYAKNIILKDRYRRVWALDEQLNILWYQNLNTGHYPFAYDIDEDGKDELMIGYSMLDDDGKILWTLENEIKDHADGVAVVKYTEDTEPTVMVAASDEGVFFTNLKGEMIKHHYIGHGQNPGVANFRDDLPGLESISMNFWGNQGIIHFYDAKGEVYHDFEPNQYGSMLLPLNWTGKSEEFFITNPNVDEGGVYDGWGRKVMDFPDDGHPDMCNAVLDMTGDGRDEIVVWNPYEIWIYTQENNDLSGKLYKPVRNSLSNYSNYQTTVSLPGWEE